MVIDKSGFLMMAGTLAAGGIGGWLVHDSKAQREHVQEPPVTKVTTPAAPTASAPAVTPVASVEPTPAAPPCDDSVGTPGNCPAFGPVDEGVCSNLAAKRCTEYKAAFKPKVAEAAVACIQSLKGNELCDPTRVNLCGHAALMAACPEPTPPSTPSAARASGNPANEALANSEASSPVARACDTILKGCGKAPIAPTLADCRQTLSGMTELGRASMIDCLATHCADKGLLGCEALKKP